MNASDESQSRLLAAGARVAWLRAIYHQESTVRAMTRDPAVIGNPALSPSPKQPPIDGPDFTIQQNLGIDVVPDTPASRQGHLDRSYIVSTGQLMTYPVPTEQFLAEVFAP